MTHSVLRRGAAGLGLAMVGTLVVTGVLGAHDFWLIPNAFAVAEGGTLEVRGQTSSRFPSSESAVALTRVALAINPTSLRASDTLSLRLLFRGRPLPSTHIHAGRAGDSSEVDRLNLETDREGIVRVPVTRPGLWNARTLHIVPAEGGTGADWDSFFVTVVVSVGDAAQSSGDSADVAAVVTRYHAALAAGDSVEALSLLAPDAVILESGGVETRDHYRSGHLPADMAFARGVPAIRANMRVVVRGDAAWVSSTSTSRGEFRGRQINSAGAELMVLSREPDGWKIRAIHWSSRNLTRAP